jgi:hypothetical protein
MKASILYTIENTAGFEDSDEMDSFFEKENHDYHVIKVHPGIQEERFCITDQVDNHNFYYLCYGRMVSRLLVDYEMLEVYWNYWCYVQDQNGKWILANEHFKVVWTH